MQTEHWIEKQDQPVVAYNKHTSFAKINKSLKQKDVIRYFKQIDTALFISNKEGFKLIDKEDNFI
jgi:hypothetical protein